MTAALVVIEDGETVLAHGDIARPLDVQAVRKSMLSLLYGVFVADGVVDLAATLRELDFDDDPPLTAGEREATIEQLLMSRSGIYHAANFEHPAVTKTRPARGSHAPGTHFYYNGWDHNALGAILARLTGRDLFASFHERIAGPGGLTDFVPEHGFYTTGEHSLHPAYRFRMTARDLARVGEIVLAHGAPVVPSAWLERATRIYSEFRFLEYTFGYGYLWYRHLAPDSLPGLVLPDHRDVVWAVGGLGTCVFVVPARRMVIAHHVDATNLSDPRMVPLPALGGIIQQVIGAPRAP